MIGGDDSALSTLSQLRNCVRSCMTCYIAISPAQFNGYEAKFPRRHELLQRTNIKSPEKSELEVSQDEYGGEAHIEW